MPLQQRTRPTLRARSSRRAGRWWLWAGLASAALAVLFGVLLVLDLLSPTPRTLSLPRVTGAPAALAAGPVSGTWTVAPGSRAGYRVHEILFGLHHTAVGRTPQVSGGITLSGSEVVAADFTVQMSSVRSDQAGRNVVWQRQIMLTSRYPRARFHLSRPIHLGAVPAVGKVISVPATGELTMRGVTRSITFTIEGERVSPSALDLRAEIPITFSEWRIPNPSFAVARVGPTGTLEVLLHLQRAASH